MMHIISTHLVAPLFGLIQLALCAENDIEIQPKQQVPEEGASSVIDQSYLGFGCEMTSFPDYAGTKENPNTFSQNLLSTFSNATGVPVFIRVGGTSMDHTHWNPDQKEAVTWPEGQGGLTKPTVVGPTWLDGFQIFENTKWVFHVPLARKNLTNAIAFTKAVLGVAGNKNMYALEIGNEVNLYPGGPRPKNYSLEDYVSEFHQFSDAIVKQTSIGEGPHFQPLALSNRSTMNEAKWNVEKAFDLGINKDGRVKTVSQHYYQTHEGQPLQGTLLNHNMTEGQTDVFKKPIDYLKKPTPPNGIEFVLGEVGSALAAGIPGRDYNLSASLGAALWNVDWMLYAMTIDVKRINMQLGRSFPFAAWQPIDNNGRKAQVLGQFYGHVFIADFIGKEGGLRVSQIDTDHKNIVAYAGYHGGKLSKVAIANLNLWAPNQTPNQTRPQRNVTLSGLPDSAKKVRVKRLTGPDATTHQDITWAGNRWTFESNGKPEKVNDNGDVVRDVGNNGSVTLNLASSQAILVHLE